ncbi:MULTISPECIES: Gfo/Idh/MocA family protein [Nocardioides]|uniref:Gfo/Idh/MocA family protein n=1 Tax=Nocardioides vastitatis TaxID=2568655 RepID=A0ABW0ZL22_9ACTN|nr:Gfo/Idh/MocA family oxidoreductase [Nocardioides sp.]
MTEHRYRPPLRVGVIGAGAMGSVHVRTLTSSVPAARVTHVFDVDGARAAAVAGPHDAWASPSTQELISASDVDAVVIASPDSTHAELVRACVEVEKPVLCEKPLAVTPEEALSLVEAEVALGRRLIQVGFMRRFDPGFLELRRVIELGELGDVRLLHAVHRNASSSTSIDDAGLITGSMIHELDTIAWLLDDQVESIRVESPIMEGFRDPQMATVWTRGGVMATVEVFVNAAYGYDVRCEVVGTNGSSCLQPQAAVSTRTTGRLESPIHSDFVAYFQDAYRAELAAWVHAAAAGRVEGPSAWDGYVTSVAAHAGVKSLSTGAREPVRPGAAPDLYQHVDHADATQDPLKPAGALGPGKGTEFR